MPASRTNNVHNLRSVNRAIVRELLFQERAAMLSTQSATINPENIQADMELTAVNYALKRGASRVRDSRNQFLSRTSIAIAVGFAVAGINIVEHLALTANEKLARTENSSASAARKQQLQRGHSQLTTAIDFTGVGTEATTVLLSLLVLGSANKLRRASAQRKLAVQISSTLYEHELPPELCDLLWSRPRKATLESGKYGDSLRRVACEAVGTAIHSVMGNQPGSDPEKFQIWQIGAASFLTRQELLAQADGQALKESDQVLADILLARVLLTQEWLSIRPGTGFSNDVRWVEVKRALHERGVKHGLPIPARPNEIALELAPT